MRIHTWWLRPLLTCLALVFAIGQARAQAPMGPGAMGYPPSYAPTGPGHPTQPGPWAQQMQMRQAQFAAAAFAGRPGVHPASYQQPPANLPPQGMGGPGGPMMGGPGGQMMGAPGGPMMGAPMMNGRIGGPTGGPGMTPMSAGSPTLPAGVPDDFDFRTLQTFLPYNAGGVCAPRWFDLWFGGTNLKRETVSRQVVFASRNIGNPPLAGDIALTSDSFDFHEEGGLRFGAQVQLGSSNVIDVNYTGKLRWHEHLREAGPLFSVFSNFGTSPFGGFADVDTNALTNDLVYTSYADTIGVNWKQTFTAPNCRIQGSTLMGIRYFQLREEFLYLTRTQTGFMDYQVNSSNSMTGFQIGGDLYVTVIPGLRFGGIFKAGAYSNRSDTETTIAAPNILGGSLRETGGDDDLAFLSEAEIVVIWKVNQNFTLRGGYQMLYADGLALAIENFNTGAPFIAGSRTPFHNTNGDLFLHGFSAGFEWMW